MIFPAKKRFVNNITYNIFNKTHTINEAGKRYTIDYYPNQSRAMTTYSVNNTEQEKKIYCGREYEHNLTTNTQYNYIYVGNMPVALYVQGDSNAMYTLHTNHLGSIEKISDKNGNVADSMSYTPFGQRRNVTDWTRNDTDTRFTDRGFTGQQHLDNFALINFNGRMYDPVLAHFLSPDPYIQSPENPLNYNRYSYCLFSPLQYVDPSGEIVEINDDIVIKGKNNSSITVKTDLIDWTINIDKDFGGNFILTPDNVAFGYEYGVDATGKAVIGSSYTGYKQSLIFLSGSYAGYWYDYVGGEAQMDVSSSAGGAIGVHKYFFLAINNNSEKYNPIDYQGIYFGTSISGSIKALGGFSLNAQYAISKDKSWSTFSLGPSVSIGAQINFFAGFGASAGAHLGGTRLIGGQPIKTRQRSTIDIINNWISHLFY